MAVSVGSDIAHSDFNGAVNTINTVLGLGSGDVGYGQNTGLTEVAATTDITSTNMQSLKTALDTARNHQTGSAATAGAIVSGNIIGADASNTTTGNSVTRSSTDTFSIDTPDATKGMNDYIQAANDAQTDRDASGGSSISISTVYDYGTANLTYTPSWQRLRAIVQVSFAGGYSASNADGTTASASADDHRRHFFNAGGQILIDTRGVNNSGSKGNDWNTIIEAVGAVVISANSVSASSGTTSLSYRSLTTTYQTIMTKSGSSGVYAENEYYIEAALISGGLTFRITYDDNDAGDQTGSGGPVDESVNTDIQIRVRHNVPTSGVIVPAGTWSIPTPLNTY